MRIKWIGIAEEHDTRSKVKTINDALYTLVDEQDDCLIYEGKYAGEVSTYVYTFSSEPDNKDTLIDSYVLTPFDDRDSADAYYTKLRDETFTHLYGVPDAEDRSLKEGRNSVYHYITECEWVSDGKCMHLGEFWAPEKYRYFVVSHTFFI